MKDSSGISINRHIYVLSTTQRSVTTLNGHSYRRIFQKWINRNICYDDILRPERPLFKQKMHFSAIFILVSEFAIMRITLQYWTDGIADWGPKISNEHYANGTTLLTTIIPQLEELISRIERTGVELGLKISHYKTGYWSMTIPISIHWKYQKLRMRRWYHYTSILGPWFEMRKAVLMKSNGVWQILDLRWNRCQRSGEIATLPKQRPGLSELWYFYLPDTCRHIDPGVGWGKRDRRIRNVVLKKNHESIMDRFSAKQIHNGETEHYTTSVSAQACIYTFCGHVFQRRNDSFEPHSAGQGWWHQSTRITHEIEWPNRGNCRRPPILVHKKSCLKRLMAKNSQACHQTWHDNHYPYAKRVTNKIRKYPSLFIIFY